MSEEVKKNPLPQDLQEKLDQAIASLNNKGKPKKYILKKGIFVQYSTMIPGKKKEKTDGTS